ncbi:MAG: hypothetical protein ABR508_01160 [Candidatus Baltobacteraceae bacterium]
MAKVSMDDEAVSIQLSLLETVLTFHGSLRVPFAHITGARAEDESALGHLWGKIIGTNAPGLKMAGTFWVDGGLAFLDYGSGRGCLVIDTTHETYRKIIVQPDAGEDARALADAINKKAAA